MYLHQLLSRNDYQLNITPSTDFVLIVDLFLVVAVFAVAAVIVETVSMSS